MQFTEGDEKHSPLQLLSPSLVCSIVITNELLKGWGVYSSPTFPSSTFNLGCVHALEGEEGADRRQR